MNVLIDVRDDIIKQCDDLVAKAKLEATTPQKLTQAQISHAKALGARNTHLANAYLKEVQKRGPRTTRRSLIMRLVEIGFAHLDELNTPPQGSAQGPTPEELYPLPTARSARYQPKTKPQSAE